MSAEPQLERSVLEAKERDELQAIAEALGQQPPVRSKKADLVDVILRATGVEAAPAEPPKLRRTVRKRVAPILEDPSENGTLAISVGHEPQVTEEVPAADDVAPEPAPDEPVATAEPAEVTTSADPVSPAAAPEPRPQPPRQPQPIGPPGPGNQLVPTPAGPTQPAGPQPHQPGVTGAGAEGEVRRNRRRRGRDRERLGAGYDQNAQQADQAYSGDPLPCDGLLDLRPEGYGFLRTNGYLSSSDDVYVSTSQVRKFALRAGDRIVGTSRPATTQERFGALLRIDAVGDLGPEAARRRPRFEEMTPVFPDERLTLETGDSADPANTTGRIIDLAAPIGKGQRGVIVSPPKAGKTTVIKHIAKAIETNHPDVDLVVVLVDERPEEVTDIRRSLKGEVVGSGFDRPAEEHAQLAELVIEVAKRRAEMGRDVVVILDGLTRLARAYNVAGGGLDAAAVLGPKRLFAAARKLEEGGSLTVVATAAVETGSDLDALIFDELHGTANMELRLERGLAERRLYPAINLAASSTSHEERLLGESELDQVRLLRRMILDVDDDGSGRKAFERFVNRLDNSRTNTDFLAELAGTAGLPLPL